MIVTPVETLNDEDGVMVWNPSENSDEENLRWGWLRSVEWIRWPYFISQPIVPVMIAFWPWQYVILGVLICNLLWYFLIRPNFVSLQLADLGALFVRLKWVICPLMGYYFYSHGQKANAAIALFWPILIIVVPSIPVVNLVTLVVIPMSAIGPVQRRFMAALGYQTSSSAENETISAVRYCKTCKVPLDPDYLYCNNCGRATGPDS
jgi:hypothetical protein